MFSVTFKNPTTGTYPIKDIQVLAADGHAFDGSTDNYKSLNLIQIQKIEGNVCAVDNATTYQFTTAAPVGKPMVGWHNMTQKTKTLEDSIVVSNGVGFLVSNTQNADVKFRFSGEVEITPMSFEIPYKSDGTAYSIFGNFTPTTISIKDIRVLNKDKKVFDGSSNDRKSLNLIQIQKIKGNVCAVDNATTYQFTTAAPVGKPMVGWHDMNQKTKTLDASIVLEPGEAVLVNNTQNEPVYFQLLNPLTGEYPEIK